jgi:hypothetical protein
MPGIAISNLADVPTGYCTTAVSQSPMRDALTSPFRLLGSSVSNVMAAFSPSKLLWNSAGVPAIEEEKGVDLDDATLRRVQMTKAFTKLRDGLGAEEGSPAAKKKKWVAGPYRNGNQPSIERHDERIGNPLAPLSARKSISKSPRSSVRVKSEPMRRSRRCHSMKKGMYSEQNLQTLAWRAAGDSSKDAIVVL